MKSIIVATVALVASATALSSAPAPARKAPFLCMATSGVCHFHIYYAAGRSRIILLPAGAKDSVPDVRIGTDSYCIQVNKNPAHKCARKIINANSNS